MRDAITNAIKAMRQAQSLNELKQLYRAFAIQFHPDHGGDEEGMKAINIEFTALFEVLKYKQNTQAKEQHEKGNWKGFATTSETPEEFIEIVGKLNRIAGIIIELCGTWIWISGETKEHKDELKQAGCKFSGKKMQWYWRHEEDYCRKHRKDELDMDEIRNLYGSQIIGQNTGQMVVFA